jgi:hypothetical protein
LRRDGETCERRAGRRGRDGGAAFAAQQVAIERVILRGEEGLLPAVAALGHVMRTAGHNDPGEACHPRSEAGIQQPADKVHCHRNP